MPDGYTPEIQIQNNQVSEQTLTKIKNHISFVNKQEMSHQNKEIQIFGDTFEMVASAENRQKHPETVIQKNTRSLIENLYQNAELILGTNHEKPSKPDGISVNFDKQGRLIVDEVVEIKSSNNAFLHGIEKGQPAKTLVTIGEIVNILNKLKKGEKTTKIMPKDSDLPLEKRIKRDVELQKVAEQLKMISPDDGIITFSPEMVYRYIVPKGEQLPEFNPHLLEDYGYAVKVEVSHSEYSKRDIHEIINKFSLK